MSPLRRSKLLEALMLYVLTGFVTYDNPKTNLDSLSNLRKVLLYVDTWYACSLVAKTIHSYNPRKSICRYFGESINENDKKILNTYCNQMCDVRIVYLTDGFSASQYVTNRFVNIPKKRVVEPLSYPLVKQLLPMCRIGRPIRITTLKFRPISGKDGKSETTAHLLVPKNGQVQIRPRVRRKKTRYHTHPSLVRYFYDVYYDSY